jgi:hypothetical protein
VEGGLAKKVNFSQNSVDISIEAPEESYVDITSDKEGV